MTVLDPSVYLRQKQILKNTHTHKRKYWDGAQSYFNLFFLGGGRG